jgi:hypothetical protein
MGFKGFWVAWWIKREPSTAIRTVLDCKTTVVKKLALRAV